MPARGPAGTALMGATARVTSRGGDTGQVGPRAAVRDADRDTGWRGSAAVAGGDVGRREQVAVARVPAVRARELAAFGFGDAPGAGGAGGRGAALAHTSPAETSSPTSRCRWPPVTRSPARAVRCTTLGDCGSRRRGMHPAHQLPPTNHPGHAGRARTGIKTYFRSQPTSRRAPTSRVRGLARCRPGAGPLVKRRRRDWLVRWLRRR